MGFFALNLELGAIHKRHLCTLREGSKIEEIYCRQYHVLTSTDTGMEGQILKKLPTAFMYSPIIPLWLHHNFSIHWCFQHLWNCYFHLKDQACGICFATTVDRKLHNLALKVSFLIRSGYIQMSLKRGTRSYRNRWWKPKRKQKSHQKTKFGRIHSAHDKVYVKVRSKLHYTRTSYSNGHECFFYFCQ